MHITSFVLQIFIFLCGLFSVSTAWSQVAIWNPQTLSQSPTNTCGSSLLFKPENAAQRQLFDNDMYTRAVSRSGEDTTHYTLPVAFHIIHQNGPENISDINVLDAMDLLNKAFKNNIPFDPATGTNIHISFCLSSGGITRHVSPLTDVMLETDDAALKQIGGFDPYRYINIWVVNSITSLNMGPAVAGYAYFPYMHGSSVDGIVVEADFVNNNPDAVKVLIHEMGHYLGLYHTFEGGCRNDDCMLDGDRVCDTPPDQSIAGVNCTGTVNTCNTDEDDASANNPFRSVALGGLGDQPDQFQNYMDYGFQACQNRFTPGQRTRMRNALLNSRRSLVDNPGTCSTCENPIVVTFDIPDTLEAGVPYTFSLNPNQPGLTYFWITDNLISTADTATIMYSQAGTLPLIVGVINPNAAECNLILRDTIVFTCAVPPPNITANPSGGIYGPGETITFSTPDNGYTYTWFVDGVQVGTGAQINYTVTGTHGRMLMLYANNGTCTAVSSSFYIDPNNCGNSKENNVWHFGNGAGINFNTNPPTAIPGVIGTDEGCAVICDANGNALYSSDGVKVKNSQTGAVLTNGDSLTGNWTTTQSALFVPQPNSQFIYLFTVDLQAGEYSGTDGGISYSIIDRNTNTVTLKNQLLTAPVVEKVTAVRNRAGTGIWVIAHRWNSNAFYAWQLTATGLSNPVISYAGTVHTTPVPGDYSGRYALGEMKASPSGRKLAVAIDGMNCTEVFDFNNATGVVSSPVKLATPSVPTDYGIAFSPNERYLYVGGISRHIARYDLQAGDAAAIDASEAVITNAGGGGGALQLAPNGKIYAAQKGSTYLGVIGNPNAANALQCRYLAEGFKLYANSTSAFGLPNPVQSVLAITRPNIIGPNQICLTGTPQTSQYMFYRVGNASYAWTHLGPNAATVVNDTLLTVTYTLPGTDTLVVKRTALCGESSDTLYITTGFPPADFSIGTDTTLCVGTSLVLNAGAGMFDYKWSNGVRKQTASFNTAGKVWAEIITPAGCVLSDTLTISRYALPELDLGADTSLCTSETITLSAPAGMDSYLWNTGATTQTVVADSGVYEVSVGKYGCIFKDTILIIKNTLPNVLVNDTVMVCMGSSNVINPPSGFDSYVWTRPSGLTETTQSVTLDEAGWYKLTYANLCTSGEDSIYHYIHRFFSVDTIFTCADTVRILADTAQTAWFGVFSPGGGRFAQNGDTLDVYKSSIYTAMAEYPAGSSCYIQQNIAIYVDTALIRPPLSINLGNDTSYCAGGVLPLDAGSGFDSYVWNTGSREAKTTAYGFGDYYVMARYCGYQYTDTITITEESSLVIKTLADTTICPDETVLLDAGDDFEWYEWSTGDTTRQITVVPGQYTVQVGLNSCMATETVNVNAIPVNYTISGDSLLCVGETITLTATQHSGYDILWDSAGVQLAGSGNVLLVSEAGTFRVKNEACPLSDWSVPFVVQEEVLSAPQFSYSPNTVCAGKPVQIGFDASPYDNFRWDDGSSDNPKTFIAPASPLLTAYGIKCSEDFAPVIQVINDISCYIGITESESCENAFSLIPNPSTSFVALSVQCDVKSPFSVSVLDYGMKNLGQVRGNLADANLLLNGLLQNLPSGGYVVRVTTEKGIFHLRWIVVK